jgi:hypothetical protein
VAKDMSLILAIQEKRSGAVGEVCRQGGEENRA